MPKLHQGRLVRTKLNDPFHRGLQVRIVGMYTADIKHKYDGSTTNRAKNYKTKNLLRTTRTLLPPTTTLYPLKKIEVAYT